jgi:hypothetical protein
MRVRRWRAISLGALLTGYTALLAGLLALAHQPIIGVLLVLSGAALALCSAVELISEPVALRSVSPGKYPCE